jgi:hypothetical protein
LLDLGTLGVVVGLFSEPSRVGAVVVSGDGANVPLGNGVSRVCLEPLEALFLLSLVHRDGDEVGKSLSVGAGDDFLVAAAKVDVSMPATRGRQQRTVPDALKIDFDSPLAVLVIVCYARQC